MHKVTVKRMGFRKNCFIDRISLIFLPKFRQGHSSSVNCDCPRTEIELS